jgi:hypothetical protein
MNLLRFQRPMDRGAALCLHSHKAAPPAPHPGPCPAARAWDASGTPWPGLRQTGSVGRAGRPQARAPAGAEWQGVGGRGRVGRREVALFFLYSPSVASPQGLHTRGRVRYDGVTRKGQVPPLQGEVF